jgi:hypothetical protein
VYVHLLQPAITRRAPIRYTLPHRPAGANIAGTMYTTDMNAVASTSALAYPATKDAAAKEREDRLLAAKKKVSGRLCPATDHEHSD